MPQASNVPTHSSTSSLRHHRRQVQAAPTHAQGVKLAAAASQSPAGMFAQPTRRSRQDRCKCPGVKPTHPSTSSQMPSCCRWATVTGHWMVPTRHTCRRCRCPSSDRQMPNWQSRTRWMFATSTRRSRQDRCKCRRRPTYPRSRPRRHRCRRHGRHHLVQTPPHTPKASSWLVAVTHSSQKMHPHSKIWTRTVANAAGVQRCLRTVHVVANAVLVEVLGTRTTTHAQGVDSAVAADRDVGANTRTRQISGPLQMPQASNRPRRRKCRLPSTSSGHRLKRHHTRPRASSWLPLQSQSPSPRNVGATTHS